MKYRIVIVLLSVILVSCQTVSNHQNHEDMMQDWQYGDLKLLDAIDSDTPDRDLIAVYTRINHQFFQVRLDFLDLDNELGKDIYIPLDTNPGGNDQIMTNSHVIMKSEIYWDYLVQINSSRTVEILDGQLSGMTGVEIFVDYDTLQDSIVISLDQSHLPIYARLMKLQVIITPSNQSIVLDKSEPFTVDSPSPSRAKLLFAFWNAFSSITPAQSLRSWAGAHAGPMSSRHGLKYLLDGVSQNNSTVFMLDLVTPDSLSALDYLNALPIIRNMAARGTLALTEVGNISVSVKTGEITKSTRLDYVDNYLNLYDTWQVDNNIKSIYQFGNFDFVYFWNKYGMLNKYYDILGSNDYAKYNSSNIPCDLLPFGTTTISNSNDLSLACKALFLSYAWSQPTTPLLLGGDFSTSLLGDPAISSKVFSYIYTHPWIQVLSLNDLITSRDILSHSSIPTEELPFSYDTGTQQPGIIASNNSEELQGKVYKALLQAPKNRLTTLAWQVFSNLTQSSPLELSALKSNYIGQIGFILAGAEWAEDPTSSNTFEVEKDYDGLLECKLTNDNIFAIVEPEGGYIPVVFARDVLGIHQIIGPTWEFIVGLSDASSWNPYLGVRGDSAQYLGAFQDQFDRWKIYDVNGSGNEISMFSKDMTMRKSIIISPNSIHVDILNLLQLQITSSIPLVIDPWVRYTYGWGDLFYKTTSASTVQWGIISGEVVEIYSTQPINVFSFNDNHDLMSFPENPNYDYSRGYYPPYPMSVAEITASGDYSIDITINP